MPILPKDIYRFNSIPIKTPIVFLLYKQRKTILRFVWSQKRPWRAKAILRKKYETEGNTFPDCKISVVTDIKKTLWLMEQKWKPTVNSLLTREPRILDGERMLLLLKVASLVSDSVRPHRQQLTRLPSPWDSPGKNTGVGYHFLLQCMKVKSESEVAQSCLTLSDPMDCSLQGSSIHRIFQARVTGVGYHCLLWGKG